jgi:hypothetical protein
LNVDRDLSIATTGPAHDPGVGRGHELGGEPVRLGPGILRSRF